MSVRVSSITRTLAGPPLRTPLGGLLFAGTLLLVLALTALGMQAAAVLPGFTAGRYVAALLVALLGGTPLFTLLWYFDRRERDPGALLIGVLLLGAVLSLGAAPLLDRALPPPAGPGDMPATAASFIAALLAEAVKGLGLLLLFRLLHSEVITLRDGVLYGTALGMGFAAGSGAYQLMASAPFNSAAPGMPLMPLVLRVFDAHVLYTAAFGAGLGLAQQTTKPWLRRVAPTGGLAFALVAPGLYNTPGAASLQDGTDAAWHLSTPPPTTMAWLTGSVAQPLLVAALAFTLLLLFLRVARWELAVLRGQLVDEIGTATLTTAEYQTLRRIHPLAARRLPRLDGVLAQAIMRAQHALAFRKRRVRLEGGDVECDPLVRAWRHELVQLRTLVQEKPLPLSLALGSDPLRSPFGVFLFAGALLLAALFGAGGLPHTLAAAPPPYTIALGISVFVAAPLLLLFRYLDRRAREPFWLFVALLSLGVWVSATYGQALANLGLPWAARQGVGDGLSIATTISIVPAAIAQSLTVLLAFRLLRGESQTLRDGVVYGALVGLGGTLHAFAAAYTAQATHEAVRSAFVAPPALPGLIGPLLWTALAGAGLGLARQSTRAHVRRLAPGGFLLLAITAWLLNEAAAPGTAAGIGAWLRSYGLGSQLALWIGAAGAILLYQGPFAALLALLFDRTVRWEHRIVHRYLADEVGTPALSIAEHERLKQEQHPWRARRLPGLRGRRAAAIINAQFELALRKWRVRRAGDEGTHDMLVRAWRHEIERLRMGKPLERRLGERQFLYISVIGLMVLALSGVLA